ncbi:MAG: hypothetical protein IH820_04050, partial [Bacteroidetes bacterium]|nr:hypothetical protein [Bacteroidota bacterium]
ALLMRRLRQPNPWMLGPLIVCASAGVLLDIGIALPPGATIGAVIRDEQVLIAHDNTVIESGDHVILFLVDKKHIRDVERLFQAGLTFF